MIAMIVMDAKNVNQSKLYIMSIPKNYLPFDVNVAQANPKRVVFRNGIRVGQIYVNLGLKNYPVRAISLDRKVERNCTIDGNWKFNLYTRTDWDLFLLPEEDAPAPEEKDVKTLHRDKNISFMMELGFEVKPMSSVGYSVYKDGVKIYYCSTSSYLQNLAKLIELHVIPYYEKRAYEKGQLDLKKTINNLLSVENHKN